MWIFITVSKIIMKQNKQQLFIFICNRIRQNPDLWAKVLENFEYQKANHDTHPHYIQRLDALFSSGMSNTLDVLSSSTEEGHDLRQVAPFWGIISDNERLLILKNTGSSS